MRKLAAAVALCLAAGAGLAVARTTRGQEPKRPEPVRIRPNAIAVRVMFGLKDAEPTNWDGSLAVADGTLLRLEGWRFRQGDRITGAGSWRLMTRRLAAAAAQRAQRQARRQANAAAVAAQPAARPRARAGQAAQGQAAMATNGVVAVLEADERTEVRVATPRGEFRVRPGEMAMGQPARFLDGAASAELVPASFQLTSAETEDDFPAAAAANDGTVWVAYVSYRYGDPSTAHSRPMQTEPQSFDALRPRGNGDQVRLARLVTVGPVGSWTDVAPLTEAGQDVYRPAIATGADGSVWVVWSQNLDDNWDLYARRYRDGNLSRTFRLTSGPGPDLHPALARDDQGTLWLAWQGFREGNADIFLASLRRDGERWSEPVRVSSSPRNDWDPQLACGHDGTVTVVWDTYDRGNYDVMMRRMKGGRLSEVVPVTSSLRFEARAHVACDAQNRVWVAWEEAPEGWGKDFGFLVQNQGMPLYRQHSVAVRCYVDGRSQRTTGELAAHFPPGLRQQQSFPRLGIAGNGGAFLTFRHPIADLRSPTGTAWYSFVTRYEGSSWSPPAVVPDSDALLDNRPSLVASARGGPLYMVFSSDGRNHAFGTNPRYQIYVAPLAVGGGAVPSPALAADETTPGTPAVPDPKTESERADLQRIRSFRAHVGEKTYRLLRGEFHRHTEISADGGGDGPLIDLWRYALDAAQLDWIGNGDHDNGGGREYTWWLIQKLTDAFTQESLFTPMFTYERSVRYPDGHRNVMFARRGIRPLPRLAGTQPNNVSPDDTKMLYRYLVAFDGICASHTSATDMGTDWRDNDPKVEPVVEIYQGDRQSYEYQGAPRSGAAGNSPGGFQPAGFVWNALAKGCRLGFQSSSDHISTHISYAVVYAEKPTREAILAGFKQRHTYGATDNIVLQVRSSTHLMGDEFETRQPARLQIRAAGTRPIARLIVVKDNRVAYTAPVGKAEVALDWTDTEAQPGTNYYYVRLEQEDGQIAWASPMWIHYRP
jgi:hypothetical protein